MAVRLVSKAPRGVGIVIFFRRRLSDEFWRSQLGGSVEVRRGVKSLDLWSVAAPLICLLGLAPSQLHPLLCEPLVVYHPGEAGSLDVWSCEWYFTNL
jgi:hypothetical protein